MANRVLGDIEPKIIPLDLKEGQGKRACPVSTMFLYQVLYRVIRRTHQNDGISIGKSQGVAQKNGPQRRSCAEGDSPTSFGR